MQEPLLFDEDEDEKLFGDLETHAIEDPKTRKVFKLENPFKRMMSDKMKTVIDDPMVKLGFGVCAYRDIIWRMFCMFTLFSLLLVPQFYTYYNGVAFTKLGKDVYT